jgi:8-oxo-dGTP pyrophosphatase MutT (NUDIX family)
MPSFSESYLGKLRAVLGHRLLLVPAARAVVRDPSGAILFQKRTDFGVWGIPGGAAEEGDSIEDCLKREVREETGITPTRYRVYGFTSNPKLETIRYPNEDVIQTFTLLFEVSEWTGELDRSNDESSELRFVPRAEAEALLAQMLPNERLTLEKYFEWERTGEFQLI